jgi:hypothetical protein
MQVTVVIVRVLLPEIEKGGVGAATKGVESVGREI